MSRPPATRLVLLLAACAALCGAADPPAPAHDAAGEALSATASELYAAAEEARARGAFDVCYARARAAFGVQAHYKIAGVLGDCALDLGKPREAAEQLSYYEAHRPEGAPADTVSYMRERLGKAKARIAVVTLTLSPAEAELAVDGAPAKAGQLFLDPGAHTFAAHHPGRRAASRKVELGAGSEQSIELVLEQEGVEPGEEPSGLAAAAPWILGIGLPVGLAAVGIGAGLYAAGESKIADTDEPRAALGTGNVCAANSSVCAAIEEDLAAGQDLRVAGGVLIGAGAAIAAVSAVLGIIGLSADDPTPNAALLPLPLPDGVGALLRVVY